MIIQPNSNGLFVDTTTNCTFKDGNELLVFNENKMETKIENSSRRQNHLRHVST